MQDFSDSSHGQRTAPDPQPRRQQVTRAPAGRDSTPTFPWSWKFATIANIDVYVHGTFLLLVAFVALSDLVAGRGVAMMLRDILLLVAVFSAVVLHEFGHALMARRFGIRILDITLLPIGGVARLERFPERPRDQLLVALAGPAVNVVLAVLLFGVVALFDGPIRLADLNLAGGPLLTQLFWINVSLAVFNLLPGFPMDGGRVFRAILAMHMDPERATQVAARVGQVFAVALGLVGLLINPLLVVIAVVVWLGARAEHSLSTVKVALAGLAVRHGMITDFRTLSRHDPLSRAVELTLAGFQQDFPVMDASGLCGVLTHADLLRGLSGHYDNLAVELVMRTEVETASPGESLDAALTRMYQNQGRVLMVVEDGELQGLLTVGNIGELLAVAAAGRHRVVALDPAAASAAA